VAEPALNDHSTRGAGLQLVSKVRIKGILRRSKAQVAVAGAVSSSAAASASISSAARRYSPAGEVQVDPGRLDRGVPGLGLDRLELHPGLSEAG
jgi:hypothetical protein